MAAIAFAISVAWSSLNATTDNGRGLSGACWTLVGLTGDRSELSLLEPLSVRKSVGSFDVRGQRYIQK